MKLVVRPDGTVEFIYHPQLVRLVPQTGLQITRASHVEPDEQGQWYVDLAPVGGPKLGPYPPDQRDVALADEVRWLEEHLLGARRSSEPCDYGTTPNPDPTENHHDPDPGGGPG